MLRIDRIQDDYCQAVYIVGNEPLLPQEDVLSTIEGDDRFFVKKTNIEGIFTYGCEQLVDEYFEHDKGYIWASRASVMNTKFDIALVECYYRTTTDSTYRICAIDLAHLESLLEETDYKIEWAPHKRGEDTDYNLVKKETV